MDGPVAMVLRIPRGTILDGAIVELAQDENGVVTAEVRIPGPPVP